jgi:hypothetical protein
MSSMYTVIDCVLSEVFLPDLLCILDNQAANTTILA